MGFDDSDVRGNWYGIMVHSPSRGIINVSFRGRNGVFEGEWDFPKLTGGALKTGKFRAIRFANWLNVLIVTPPLLNVQCQLAVLKERRKSMVTGIIPLKTESIPFATITLFRHKPPPLEINGLCPVAEPRPKRAER